MRFTPNANKLGRTFVKPTHNNFVQYSNTWWIKFLRYVHAPCLFHLMHAEELIIIFNILYISILQRWNNPLKPINWYILINSEGCIFRHIRRRCQQEVTTVVNCNLKTHAEPTSKPPDKLSKVHWMFKNIIRFGDEWLF